MKNNMIKVKNRSTGTVVYSIPELRVRRSFTPQETKEVSERELKALLSIPGGREMLYHYLMVDNESFLHDEVNVNEEPEYWLTEDKIPGWLNTCSLEEFKDALDFAPAGVIDLIKQLSVSLPLNDVAKRAAIKEQLNYDVTKAIELMYAAAREEEEKAGGNSQRRTSPSYKPTAAK